MGEYRDIDCGLEGGSGLGLRLDISPTIITNYEHFPGPIYNNLGADC